MQKKKPNTQTNKTSTEPVRGAIWWTWDYLKWHKLDLSISVPLGERAKNILKPLIFGHQNLISFSLGQNASDENVIEISQGVFV